MSLTPAGSTHVARNFCELEHYGFTVETVPASLGTDGKGRAPHWRLTELETASALPTIDFKNWDGTKFQQAQPRRPRKRPLPEIVNAECLS
jgi:hypothetical protein